MSGGAAYSTIGQVKDISGPNISRGDVDVTDHESADGYREFLPGLADGGDVSFTVGLDKSDSTHVGGAGTGLLGDFEQDGCTLPAWKLILNACSGTFYWTFDGYVNGFSPSSPVEGEHTADISIKVSAKPTLTTS